MNVRSARRSRNAGWITLAFLTVVGAGACTAKNGATDTTPITASTIAAPRDSVCDDPAGDLADKNTPPAGRGTGSEPAGIDLLHGEAKASATSLHVVIRTNGPINSVKLPAFFVSNGPTGSDTSFELRFEQVGPGETPAWGVNLVTFKSLRENRVPLRAPVTIDNDTLTVDIPLTDLPPIVAQLWQYGSVSGEEDAAISDDCNNFSDTPTTTGPGGTSSSTPRSTAPPTSSPPIPFGTEQTYPTTGSKVTVYEVQFPPKNPKTFSGTTIPFDAGFGAAVIDAQVCAPADKGTTVSAGSFQIKSEDNRLYPYWAVSQAMADPAFPVSQPLAAGDCIRGWITVEVPTDAKVGAVYYSPSQSGRNFLIWKP